MYLIIATAIVAIAVSVGVSAAIIIKITAEIQRSMSDRLMEICEENFKDSMQFYKSINEMLTKAGF